jgi:hydroxymethylglutaryl-CoA reductase (NADPH)
LQLSFLESQYPPFRNDYTKDACDARRMWTEAQTGASLRHMGQWMEDMDTTSLKGNIEMPMGLIKLPVASVGPLIIHGEEAKGKFIAPMATTEGALTASMMRGVKALNAGSGVVTRTGKQFCSRGPCFVTKSASQALTLGTWTEGKREFLQQEVVSKVSSHAKLEQIIPVYDFEVITI